MGRLFWFLLLGLVYGQGGGDFPGGGFDGDRGGGFGMGEGRGRERGGFEGGRGRERGGFEGGRGGERGGFEGGRGGEGFGRGPPENFEGPRHHHHHEMEGGRGGEFGREGGRGGEFGREGGRGGEFGREGGRGEERGGFEQFQGERRDNFEGPHHNHRHDRPQGPPPGEFGPIGPTGPVPDLFAGFQLPHSNGIFNVRSFMHKPGLHHVWDQIGRGTRNFLAPTPMANGIPPHVMRRIIRFCSKPRHQNHPKCQNHPEWITQDQLPEHPHFGAGGDNSENEEFPGLLNFRLRPVPRLNFRNIFENVPDDLKSLAPPVFGLHETHRQHILNTCADGSCLKQPLDALSTRATIAEHETATHRLIHPDADQDTVDSDIETRLARTQELKLALIKRAGLEGKVVPRDDGIFEGDSLLSTEQAEHLINAVQNDDPSLSPIIATADGRNKRSGIYFEQNPIHKWAVSPIPYYFDPSLSASDQAQIQQALNQIQSKTCVRFQKLSYQPNDNNHIVYIKYQTEAFCGLSNIGFSRTSNPVYLTFTCPNTNYMGVALHETLHSLGLQHEMVRGDRDEFITINWNNVDPSQFNYFGIADAKLYSSYGVTYDYGSIMHYGQTIASKYPGQVTMVAKNNPSANGPLMGQRTTMSARDVELVNKMYCKSANCVDNNIYCGAWANKGKCSNAPNSWIFQNCKKSCNFC